MLQKSFSERILAWFPLFNLDSWPWFILALSGLDYFCAASDILDLDKDSRYTLFETQCHILKACVSLYTQWFTERPLDSIFSYQFAHCKPPRPFSRLPVLC